MNLDIQLQPDPFINLGVHLDHHAPYIALHLPGVMVAIGNITTSAFDWSLKRFIQGQPNRFRWDRLGSVIATCGVCGQTFEVLGNEIIGCPYCEMETK